MKSTGRYSEFEEIEDNPSKPFINDIQKDLEKIDKHYLTKVAVDIKKQMIETILKSM